MEQLLLLLLDVRNAILIVWFALKQIQTYAFLVEIIPTWRPESVSLIA